MMKKKSLSRFANRALSIVLSMVLILLALASCSLGKNDRIHRVRGTLSEANDAEQAMNAMAGLSINYYLTARACLDTFLAYDTESMDAADADGFVALLNRTVSLFEDVEKLSGALDDSVRVWEESPDGEKASYQLLAAETAPFPVGLTAYADDETPAKKWAQDIVDAYDKAPAGHGIRTLAEQMGTDAKHAYAQLKQALAVLDGAEYAEIADKANTAVQVATTLKATGTAAGLVIAVAAAPAAGTLGAIAKTGGVVCSGINTVLEVGSAGSVIYHNGEDNEISIACDKTEAQFAPVGQVFSIMGVGQALKDVGKTGKDILEKGYQSLSEKDKQALGENTFSLLSTAGASLNDYVNDGSILSGTFKKTDKGVEFTLADTLAGTDKDTVANVETVLRDTGIDKKTVKEALRDAPEAVPDGSIPTDIAESIVKNNAAITDANASADNVVTAVDETLDRIENGSIAMAPEQKDAPSIDDEIHTPDDAFDGEYAEFTGKDGSITRVFDNGSVSTKSKDGSVTAVDYKGNQYEEDKDGNSTVRTPGGYVATEYADGRQSLTEPNGKTTTVEKDGSFSEDYGVGLTLEYDADGGLTGIGITGSDERIETDESGCYRNGEISGPGGSKLTITDDGLRFVNSEGTVYDHTDIGSKRTTTVQWKDGSHCEAETDVSWDGEGRTENTDFTLTDSDGNHWESNRNVSYDAGGNPTSVNNNVAQWTGPDGSILWVDHNTNAVQYSDQDGNILITDSNGNLTEYRDGKNSWNVTYDENGNVTSADITYADGARMVKNPDGTTTFTLPDGTVYESDGSGNVSKDGQVIKEDGHWTDANRPEEGGDTPDDNTSDGDDAPPDEPEVSGGSVDDFMGTWSYNEGSIAEQYTFSRSGNTITVTMIATKSDGTTSEPVSFPCSYRFDGTVLVISNTKWYSDMSLRLLSKDTLEITASATVVLKRK